VWKKKLLLLGNVEMKSLKFTILLIVMGLGFAPSAFAKKSKRSGFNFGTSVRMLDTDDRTTAGIGADRDTHTVESSQMVVPYFGYSFESFNLGVRMSSEQEKSKIIERSDDGFSETERDYSSTSKGVSIFARFNFGRVFFFEIGTGGVNKKINVSTENKEKSIDGSFTGDEDKYEVKGVGPGYHAGMGMEFSMGGGFYFTSAYHTRIIQLRDFDGKSELGAKRTFEQKREVLFGIAHYTK
jgi:hypothetical protein